MRPATEVTQIHSVMTTLSLYTIEGSIQALHTAYGKINLLEGGQKSSLFPKGAIGR